MNTVIKLGGVSVVRGDATLLDDITWEVREGERWVLLGPNGAGKTTLLSVVSTNLFPSTGTVSVLGETIGAVDVFELRPRIGLTSAALADRIPRHEKVVDLIISAAYAVIGRWREEYDDIDHKRAEQLMGEIGVAHLGERRFGTLSEGERKRVQIARSLMADPELLLMDEPAAGLDLGGREDLVSTMQAVAQDPAAPTTVMVSHHVEEIPPAFTHVMMLRRGRIMAMGPVDETLTADRLSKTFGMPLQLHEVDGRWYAWRRTAAHRRH